MKKHSTVVRVCPICAGSMIEIDEMSALADRYAHRMAMHLECIMCDSGKFYNEAMQTLGEYRSAMNAIHERVSPTFMGEPVLPEGCAVTYATEGIAKGTKVLKAMRFGWDAIGRVV